MTDGRDDRTSGGAAAPPDGTPDHEWNRRVFDDAAVVATYTSTIGLSPAERQLVDDHVPPGASVLDLGVGAGRTTPALTERAGRYVGIDVSPTMIEAARRSFPGVDLRVGDAAELGELADGTFDVVLFSYNGIDYLHPDAARHRCLTEVARVLRPGGRFVYSSHDPRAVLSRPKPRLGSRRYAVAALQTARRMGERLPHRAFWAGDGWLVDRVPPQLLTHMATPRRAVEEAERFGFRHLRTLPGDPEGGGRWSTSWWYYVLQRA